MRHKSGAKVPSVILSASMGLLNVHKTTNEYKEHSLVLLISAEKTMLMRLETVINSNKGSQLRAYQEIISLL